MKFAVDADDRGQATRTDTGDDFHAEQAVASSLAGLDFQGCFQRLKHGCGTLYMAGSAPTHLNVKPARRVEPELVVKRSHAVYLARREIQMPADANHRILGDIPVGVLYFLENRYQRISPCLVMPGQNSSMSVVITFKILKKLKPKILSGCFLRFVSQKTRLFPTTR